LRKRILIFRYKTLFGVLFVAILNCGTAASLRGGMGGALAILNKIDERNLCWREADKINKFLYNKMDDKIG